ncbi:methylornithine synthase PylB [bacterium 210820-DFI.6.37]|nr:methylornithine synthase PylB [bacterium 210820-DFI.6.37]
MKLPGSSPNLERKARKVILSREQIISILKSDDKQQMEDLFAKARNVREKIFGKKVFLYGFVYFTTWCRNDCTFCYYRKSNEIERYRKDPEEVFRLSKELADSGVHLIDLTMGEDLRYYSEDFNSLVDIINQIKSELGLPVMISPGVLNGDQIEKISKSCADWYALYQETHNKALFEKLRINQSYDERMRAKLYAKEKGMLIEEGIMSGIGESYEDIADSLIEMGRVGASQMRIMSFVPQIGSPMEKIKTPDRMIELKAIALMRIAYPWALIPTSLDVDGIAGLEARLNAGGNVVTSIIPPRTGLAGVAQNSMDVDDGGRTVEEVKKILERIGLEAATAQEYKDYIGKLKCRK